jgi:hypothetical protein
MTRRRGDICEYLAMEMGRTRTKKLSGIPSN